MTAERHSLHFQSAPADPVDKWEHDDKPREECGVFGVFGSEDASVLTALGLHGLQHRGQEGCGIVSYDGDRFYHERYLGLVGEHFAGGDVRPQPVEPVGVQVPFRTPKRVLIRPGFPVFGDVGFVGHGDPGRQALRVQARCSQSARDAPDSPFTQQPFLASRQMR